MDHGVPPVVGHGTFRLVQAWLLEMLVSGPVCDTAAQLLKEPACGRVKSIRITWGVLGSTGL